MDECLVILKLSLEVLVNRIQLVSSRSFAYINDKSLLRATGNAVQNSIVSVHPHSSSSKLCGSALQPETLGQEQIGGSPTAGRVARGKGVLLVPVSAWRTDHVKATVL